MTLRDSRGFSLIETLVVLAIIVTVTMVALPSVSSYFQVSLNSATRDLATNIKEAFNASMLTGKVYRVVYDFKTQSFWVEGGPVNVLMDTKESKEKEERRRRFAISKEKDKDETGGFTMDTAITRKKIKLPRGVEFEDILTEQSPEPIKAGLASTHFFPHGITEQTLIHLQDQSKHHATLVISPLLGMTDVYDRYVKQDEAFPKP